MFRLILRDESGAVLYDSSLPFRLNFNATGIEEVVQNLVVLLLTPLRSQMLDRALGLPMRFIDKPLQIAQNILVAEINEQVPQFEDRVEIRDVVWLEAESSPERGHLAASLTLAFPGL